MRREHVLLGTLGVLALIATHHPSSKPVPPPQVPPRKPPSGKPSTAPNIEGIIRGRDLIQYRTESDGLILVAPQGTTDVTWQYPKVTDAKMGEFRTMIDHWKDLVDEMSADFNLPASTCFGVMWAEGHDPNAVSRVGAVGLFQVMPANFPKGTTPAMMKDPKTNAQAAGRLLRAARAGGAHDLPQIASYYNAGGYPDGSPWTNEAWLKAGRKPEQTSHWGYACEPGYIDRVVAASNTYILLASGQA